MQILKKYILLTTILVFVGVNTASARLPTPQEQAKQCELSLTGIVYKNAVAFVKKLQIAIRNNDKKTIADMAVYPLRVNKLIGVHPKIKNIHYFISNRKELISQYHSIFSHKMRKSILTAKPTDIFCNYQGGAVAGGSLWITGDPPSFFVANISY